MISPFPPPLAVFCLLLSSRSRFMVPRFRWLFIVLPRALPPPIPLKVFWKSLTHSYSSRKLVDARWNSTELDLPPSDHR